MATKVADLYADLSIRGDDFDRKLAAGKDALQGVSKAADESGEKVRQSAIKSATAYQRVSTEADKAGQAARKAAQQSADAAERERIVRARLADTISKHGTESEQAARQTKKLEDAQRDSARAADRAEKAQDQLQIVHRRVAQQAQNAASAMRDAEKAMRGMDDATPDGSKIDKFFDALGQASTRGTEVAATRGGMFGSDFLGGFSAKIAGIGGKAGPIGAALVGVAAIGLSAGALLAKAIADGAEKEAAQDLIQAKLGVDEKTAARIGDAAGKAYTNAFGESSAANMDAARAAMQAGLLPKDAGQGEIQKTIEQLDTVSQIMGADIPEVARAAGQAIRTGLVANGTEAMDLFTAATQAGLDTSGDLLDTITEYGTQFRKVGIDGPDALGLVSQALKNGARDTDVAADAIKEFSIRAVDGSESTATAFSDLGLNAEDMAAKFAAGGDSARGAFDQVLDAVRGIEDPVKRGQVAVALFGTQAEDLGDALGHMDLSTARDELGETAGAAQRAADTIGGNARTSWESLTRTVESAVGGIKQSMAEAFGPTAADLAAQLLENKDEIAAFFADTVAAALTFGEGMAQVAVGALHAWGFFARGVGDLLSNMTGAIGLGGQVLGDFISMIPGMEEKGESIKNVAATIAGLGDRMRDSGDRAHGLANVIADDVIPGMVNMRDRVAATGDAARLSADGMNILRDSVIGVPDDKTIIISDNSPETIAKLEALGLKVETLPDGTVKVTADTAEGERVMQEFQSRPRVIDIRVRANFDPDARALYFGDRTVQGPVPITQQAVGSVREAQTSNTPILWGEAGPEAYIPLSNDSRRPRAIALASEVADRFGYGLVRRMAEGGIVRRTAAEMDDFARGVEGMDYVFGGWGQGWNTDCSGAVSRIVNYATGRDPDSERTGTGNMGAFLAERGLVPGIGPSGAMTVGWLNGGPGGGHTSIRLPSGTNVEMGGARGNGQFGGGAADPSGGNFTDHMYLPAENFSIEPMGGAPSGPADPRQAMANKIIAEGRRRGYSDAEIKAILSTALQESNLDPAASGGGGAWRGVFQQDQSYPGREDPGQNIAAFYDRLDEKRKASPGGDIWKDIFWLQQAPGSASAESAYAGGRQEYLSEIQSRQSEADTLMAAYSGAQAGASSGAAASRGSSSMPSSVSINGVVQVEVTNWPAALTAEKPVERTPLYSANFKMYGQGGVADIARPGDYRVWGEPETGGEAYIPFATSKRSRSLAIWAETGRRLGVPGFASGGFGGYTKDTSDYMRPKSLYDFAALGAGLGFTAYNAIQPYVAMAQSGRIDLGNLTPIIDTGANDLPGVASAIGDALNAQMEQVTAILQAILNRTPVEVNVEVDSGTGAAGLQLTKIGQ